LTKITSLPALAALYVTYILNLFQLASNTLLAHVRFLFNEVLDGHIFQADYGITVYHLTAKLVSKVISEITTQLFGFGERLSMTKY
jgi:hypothetical protein